MVIHNKFFIILLYFMCGIALNAQDLIYQEKKGDNQVFDYHYYFEVQGEKQFSRCVRLEGSDTIEDQTLVTNKDNNSLSWKYERSIDNTNVMAKLRRDYVELRGTRDGEKISEDFDLDEHKWIQVFPLNPGLEKWFFSESEEIRFWVIGTAASADMEMNKFVAEKEEGINIRACNEIQACVRVNITLSGWRSMFWDGDFFFRKSDGRIIKYDGGGPPGEPGSVTLLVSGNAK